MISKSSVSFSTLRFEREYGKKPRGFGDWFFLCKGNNGSKEVNFLGKFSEAKKKAIEFCSENNYVYCSTLS